MAAAFECDWCGDLFKKGFQGGWNKIISKGDTQFDIKLTVSKSPHLCKKCWSKWCKLFYDELRGTYVSRIKS
jgi:hypothetical protein